ncbi:MAG: radical SAM protein, partial [Oscillospiraceae bacterium]|nr:radical SAM protein [Oscillospiraceae bacterium]
MHFDGPTFRPPTENFTPLLQVTVGCSYNKCAFCSMYRCTQFHMSPEEEIIEDLKELAAKNNKVNRIFLLNGDPFVLSADKLLHISALIHRYLPRMCTITCYCSFVDLRNKSLEDLVALRKAGYNDLYIGIETGYEPALKLINKGYTISEAE